jgi:hypothetical protein
LKIERGYIMGKMNLLKESRRAFQFLHNTCGMDFKKPYVYVEGNGKFTLKTLERMMNLEGNPYQYKIALFLGGVGCNTYPYSHISCVQIVGFDSIEVNFTRSCYVYDIDTFYAKKAFEGVRKHYGENCKFYVVAQKNEYLRSTLQKRFDLSGRFKMKDVCPNYTYAAYGGERYISRVCLYDATGDKNCFEVKPFQHTIQIEDIIDKSGYLVESTRNELKCRAKERRKQKAADEAKQADYSQKNAAYKQKIEDIRDALVDNLKAITTNEAINCFNHAMRYYVYLLSAFNDHMRMVSNGAYLSVERIKQRFNEMDGYIGKIQEELSELDF